MKSFQGVPIPLVKKTPLYNHILRIFFPPSGLLKLLRKPAKHRIIINKGTAQYNNNINTLKSRWYPLPKW